MAKPNNKNLQKVRPTIMLVVVFIAFLSLPGFLGLLFNRSNRLSGFLWGFGIGLVVGIVGAAVMFGWEWIKKEAEKDKLLPYLLVGFLAAIAISGTLAVNLGKPSCDEQGDAPYSSCVSYGNDGFEATSAQRWHKFWEALPIATIICFLIAYIAHDQVEKNRPKHFKSDEDRFSVSIFPEKIGTANIIKTEGSRLYKYDNGYLQYFINVVTLEGAPQSKQDMTETIKLWQEEVMSDVIDSDAHKLSARSGTKQGAPYIYQAYEEKDGTTYHSFTLIKYGNIYDLYMYTRKNKGYNGHTVFFEFVNSFNFD